VRFKVRKSVGLLLAICLAGKREAHGVGAKIKFTHIEIPQVPDVLNSL
jgi:hypothetical protein